MHKTDQERASLVAKGYPVRIRTVGGRYFYTQPGIGALVYGPSTSMFATLPEAVRYAIREVETRRERYYAL